MRHINSLFALTQKPYIKFCNFYHAAERLRYWLHAAHLNRHA